MVNSWIYYRIKSEYTVMLLKAKEGLLSQSKNVDTLSCCSFIHFNIFVINNSNNNDDNNNNKDFVSGGWHLIAKGQ